MILKGFGFDDNGDGKLVLSKYDETVFSTGLQLL